MYHITIIIIIILYVGTAEKGAAAADLSLG